MPLVDWLKVGMILKNIVKFLEYINTSANKRSMIKIQLDMWYEVQNHYRMSSRLLVIQGSWTTQTWMVLYTVIKAIFTIFKWLYCRGRYKCWRNLSRKIDDSPSRFSERTKIGLFFLSRGQILCETNNVRVNTLTKIQFELSITVSDN